MKYIKNYEHIEHIEMNPNGITFIKNISELQNFDKPKAVIRILKMIDDNPQYVNYIRKDYITSPIDETITKLSNKPFVTKISKMVLMST